MPTLEFFNLNISRRILYGRKGFTLSVSEENIADLCASNLTSSSGPFIIERTVFSWLRYHSLYISILVTFSGALDLQRQLCGSTSKTLQLSIDIVATFPLSEAKPRLCQVASSDIPESTGPSGFPAYMIFSAGSDSCISHFNHSIG